MSSRPAPKLRLDALVEFIAKLEAKRKELEREVQEKEILEKVLAGEIDLSPEQDESLHRECVKQSELEEAQDARQEEVSDLWRWVAEFASHTAACCHGALVGLRRPHRLCTCGFNEVATELERQ